MKEITRIHLAKVSYDIELSAKKSLEKYCKDLAFYAGDDEVMQDIEVRMTELFAERGVTKDGVITADDVAAIRKQLGEPSDFAPEGAGDIAVGATPSDGPNRRLYRDTDGAILGGVLAGVARFFGISPVWTRLIFIVILIASFGTALVIYLILWVVVPPARTAAEKLQMDGKPVTLESIKRLGEQAVPAANKTAAVLKGVIIVGAGVTLLLMAITALMVTIVVGGSVLLGFIPDMKTEFVSSGWFIAAFWLFIVSGLLLAALCTVLSLAVFRRQWSPRTTITTVVIIVAGVITFSCGAGTMLYGNDTVQRAVHDSRKTTSINLPENFKNITALTVETNDDSVQNARIEYTVSDKSYWQLEALSGVKPQFTIADNSASATVKLVVAGHKNERYWRSAQPILHIYGPALSHIQLNTNTTLHYATDAQQDAVTIMAKLAQFELSGRYGAVNITTDDSSADLSGAAVTSLSIDNKRGEVTAGVVRNLSVTQPDSCAIDSSRDTNASVEVQSVSSGKITYNGNEQTVKNSKNACGEIIIESEDK